MPTALTQSNLDIQQPIVSTIKEEEMEFVEVNQDEMPGDTWDSFESDNIFDNLDISQANTESAATSTTKIMELHRNKGESCVTDLENK